MDAPIFIIGNPRSGTTLLRLMLTCHENIVIPPECGFAVWWHEKYKDWGESRVDDFTLSEFISDLMRSKKIETWNVNEGDLSVFLRQRSPPSYSELVSSIYEWYGSSRGRIFKRWGDKNNFHIHQIPTIKSIFPNAWFVHIVRDGRDVACSYKEVNMRQIDSPYAPSLPNEIADIAEQWKTNIEVATESFTRIEWEDVCELRFEDLVLDTERSLRKLCRLLDEEYDPSMLNYHQINRDYELEPEEFLQWKEKTLEEPTRDVVGRYIRGLTDQEISTFEKIAGDGLRRYGYLRSIPGNQ